MKKLLLVILIAMALVLPSCGKKVEDNGSQNPPQSEQSGEETNSGDDVRIEAADFELTSLSGKSVKLSDYRGRVVLLNFLTTWCPYCEDELPALLEAREKYKDVEFVFIDIQEDKKTIEEFLKKGKYGFDPLMDTSGEVAGGIYGVRSLPTTLIIDREGYIVDFKFGPLNEAEIKEKLDKALNKK